MTFQNRKLPRLKEYDYSTPGAYFITICTHDKLHYFGNIVQGKAANVVQMQYSPVGKIAKNCLLDIQSHYQNIKIDNWVIMPNHIHILIRITERMDPFPTEKRYDIPNVIGKYKAAVTRAAGNTFMYSGKLWQSSFYDHIIRNDEDYQNIWQYISGNPSRWMEDSFYTE